MLDSMHFFTISNNDIKNSEIESREYKQEVKRKQIRNRSIRVDYKTRKKFHLSNLTKEETFFFSLHNIQNTKSP